MAKHILKTFLATAVILSQTVVSIFANVIVYDEKVNTTVLMEGLTYKEIQRTTSLGFLDIYILEYDINNENIELDILRNNEAWAKRTTLTSMANSDTLAGVNASFFDTSATYSDILGFELEDGKVVYAKNEYNRSLAQASSLNQKEDGSISFGYISNQIKFATESGVTIYVNSVNGMQDFENATVFTGNVISDTSYVDSIHDLYKIVIQNGRVVRVVPPKTVAYLSETEIALVTKDENIVQILPVNTGVIYSVETNLGKSLEDYELILSGGGTILKNGEVLQDGIQVSSSLRAPRTAIGTTEDERLIVMAVDGRGNSIGANFNEMAQLLLEQGVTNAIHFDGGGSTEVMAINYNGANVITNTPSDGKERNISNGLGFLSTTTDSQLTRLELVPSNNYGFVGNGIKFTLIGYDQYGKVIYIDNASGTYTVEGIDATVEGNSVTPLTEGIGIVRVNYAGLEAYAPIDVVSTAKDITVKSALSKINTNGYTQLLGTLTTNANNTIPFDVNNAILTLTNPNMGYIENGYFYSSGQVGVAYVQVQYAGVTKVVAIEVINPFDDFVIDYTLNDSYSLNDSKYINITEAQSLGYKEMIMFGRIELKSNNVVDRVAKEINNLSGNSELKIFSGGILTPKGMSLGKSNLYRNKFDYNDYEELNTKILNLETYTSNSSNINQLYNIVSFLESNDKPNIIIQNSDPNYDYFSNSRFNTKFREVLDEYVKETGYNVYVVNGSLDRKNISVDNLGGVTYIQIPTQVFVEENSRALTNEIYFYLDNDGVLRYSFKN